MLLDIFSLSSGFPRLAFSGEFIIRIPDSEDATLAIHYRHKGKLYAQKRCSSISVSEASFLNSNIQKATPSMSEDLYYRHCPGSTEKEFSRF